MVCKTVNRKMYGFDVRTVGRKKRIWWDRRGEPFFKMNGASVYLDEVQRLSYPIMYEDREGKVGAIGGVYVMGLTGVYVEISDDDEFVQLWEDDWSGK